VFWALEQLSRQNAGHAVQLLDKLSRWSIGFCSYTEQHLDSCHILKETVTSILATLVHQNSVYLSEQTRVGIERQQKTKKRGPSGRLGPGRPPVEFDKEKAIDLRSKKRSYDTIAAICGVSKATISRFFKQKRQQEKEPWRRAV
jgi:DNA invertase Pin-like site-specific DNA recombinase